MRRLLMTAMILGAAAGAILAHELPDASATVIVREGGYVQIRMQVPYADVMNRVMAPQQLSPAFVAAKVNVPAAEFERDVARVNAIIARETALVADGGRPVPLRRWQWPAADQIHQAFRTAMMAAIAAPGRHDHLPRFTVIADGQLAGGIRAVQVRLPVALGAALVTAYHPQERWVTPGQLSPALEIAVR